MSPALGVVLPQELADLGGVAAALASLPLSLRRADQVANSVVVVDGGPGWVDRIDVAVHDGAAGVLLVDPTPTDLTGLSATLRRQPVVVVDSRWASNPAVASAAGEFSAAVSEQSRLETRLIVAVGSNLDAALLEQLLLVRRLLGPVKDLRVLDRTSRNYYAEACTDAGLVIDLSAVCTDALAPFAQTRLLTADGSVELEIPTPTTARPARVTRTGPDGLTQSPTRYESAHRASWRRLLSLLRSAGRGADLTDLSVDLATLSRSLDRTFS